MQATNDIGNSVLIQTYSTTDALNHLMECYIVATGDTMTLQNHKSYLKYATMHITQIL
jgi:hypothetical protein